MPQIDRANGVQLTLPDGVRVTSLGTADAPPAGAPPAGAPGAARRAAARARGTGRLPTAPIPMPDADDGGAGPDDPLVASLRAQELTLVDALEIAAPPAPPARRGGPGGSAGELAVEVAEGEGAVVLFEQDGLYTWQLPDDARTTTTGVRRRGAVVEPARTRFVFDLEFAPGAPAPTRRRGPIGDFVVGKVRAYVFRFLGRAVAGQAVRFLERDVRPGLVVMRGGDPARWTRVEDLGEVSFPDDRAPRILLFVHGTFSSTLGSYGALAAADWGRAFLALATAEYDLVVGYDHRTLSEDPLANAADLLARLERARVAHPPVIDAVAYSRGALVLRSLVEYLLPTSALGMRVRRAVFVGGTNGGTQLAESANWKRLADLATNLAVAASRAVALLAPPAALTAKVLEESIRTLGALVKHLASAAVDDGGVPGLAAMSPSGAFVAALNGPQPGQPGIADSCYCVVTSEFDAALAAQGGGAPELPKRLVQWVLDGLADGLMRESNDLVVDTASMTRIDPGSGVFVKDRLDFGLNPHVYHTVYFTRPEVVRALTRWLGLETEPTAATLPAAAEPDVLVVGAGEPYAEVAAAIRRELPSHVVVRRGEHQWSFHYAYTAAELLGLEPRVGSQRIDMPLGDALTLDPELEMHESGVSPYQPQDEPLPPGWRPPPGAPRTAQRMILFDGDVPRAVVEAPTALPSSAQLGAVSQRIGLNLRLRDAMREARRQRDPGAPAPAPPARTADVVDHITRRRMVPRVRAVRPAVVPAPAAPPVPSRERQGQDEQDGLEGRRQQQQQQQQEQTSPAPRPRVRGQPVEEAGVPPVSAPQPVPAPAPAAPAPMPAPAPTVATTTGRCYYTAAMPGVVGVEQTVPVEVALSRDVIEIAAGATSAGGSGEVDFARTIRVQLIPKTNLEIVGDSFVELPPWGDRRRFDLLFEVRGTNAGDGEVLVVVRQGPLVAGTLTLRPQVVAAAATPGAPRVVATGDAAPEPPLAASYPVLQIFERRHGTRLTYLFVLDTGDGAYLSRDSDPLQADREGYVARIYEEIENRWLSARADADAFEEELRALGGQLLDELVPLDVQQALWRVRTDLHAIHVLSEEPFIPWEIVHLKPPRQLAGVPEPLPDETHFLAQKGLVRWLHNRGRAARRLRVRPGHAFYVIPDYPHPDWTLPAAQREIPFLTERLGAAPLAAEANAIRARLRGAGSVDLLHFSGHGEADAEQAGQARLMLAGRVEQGAYVPLYFTSGVVQQAARLAGPDGGRPLVVLNACQVGRADWQLTSIGGFAEAFLRAGAGAFVSSLWSVGDEPARTFTEGFYGALLDGAALAQAAVAGREAARSAREATWLAYVVYGHPLATLHLESDRGVAAPADASMMRGTATGTGV
ncbi:MAG TPA: CHAT domain-containing protein [Gemmatimonadaceae bacterium]|nr:CHAT domain-containing protein [Gemmatimonadaceae bacterium]